MPCWYANKASTVNPLASTILPMNFEDLPVFITLLAAAYLLMIYGLLIIAERVRKEHSSSRDVGKASN
jgi:hypothetical protein